MVYKTLDLSTKHVYKPCLHTFFVSNNKFCIHVHRPFFISEANLMRLVFLICLATIVSCVLPHAYGGIISTFDSGLDGWTSNTPSEISFTAAQGNPDGYVRFVDGSAVGTFIFAPSKFLGDWTIYDGTGVLKYDHRVFAVGTTPSGFPPPSFNGLSLTISGNGNSAVFTDNTIPQTADWNTMIVPIDENDVRWSVSGNWSNLIVDVQQLEINIERINNPGQPPPTGEIDGVDNVSLSAVPEPSSLALFLLGGGMVLWRRHQRRELSCRTKA